MKIAEIRKFDKAELEQKLKELKEQLYKLSCERLSGRVDKPDKFKTHRKDIARIKTILNEAEKKNE